jgi:tRNA-dihydrouridine synthase B
MQIGGLRLVNPLILAPMAGITNLPFRLLAKEFGAALVYSEMVSGHGLVRNHKHSRRYLVSRPAEKPLTVQLFGADPVVFAEAARIAVEAGADVVDINLGCPVKKVVRAGAGCALMREPDLVKRILRKVRRAVNVPLTIKIRAGWDERQVNAVQIARIAEDCGVDAVAVHGRTRSQGFVQPADWNVIARVKAAVSCTVIGNGDVRTPADAERMLAQTGCDGVMIGRAARGNPWIFARINHYLTHGQALSPPGLAERKAVILRHFELLGEYYGLPLALLHMRKHLGWYTQNLPHSSAFRRLINTARSRDEFLQMIDDYWRLLQQS